MNKRRFFEHLIMLLPPQLHSSVTDIASDQRSYDAKIDVALWDCKFA